MKFVLIAFSIVCFAGAVEAKNCKTGKACGNTCIAKEANCSMESSTQKKCTKGKPCGNSCIAKDAACTKH